MTEMEQVQNSCGLEAADLFLRELQPSRTLFLHFLKAGRGCGTTSTPNFAVSAQRTHPAIRRGLELMRAADG